MRALGMDGRLGRGPRWVVLGVLLGILAITLPELGSDPWPFKPGPVEPRGILAPLVRAAGEEWDVGIARSACFLAALGVALVGAVCSGLVLAGRVGLLTAAALSAPEEGAAGPTTRVWGEAEATNRLLALPVQGVIYGHEAEAGGFGQGVYGYEVARVLDDLDAEEYDGVVLEMNTPGGTIYGARAITDAVERYQKRTGNKVVAFVQGVSASGGMYAMAGADSIVADHGTLVGSIGVIMGPFEHYEGVIGYTGSLFTPGVQTTGGITQEYFTAGKGKDLGNPFRKITAEERSILVTGLQQEYDAFVSHVSATRGIPAATIRDTIGAHVYGPKRAVELGLVDREGDQMGAYQLAAELNGADAGDTAVYRQEAPGLLPGLLGAQSSAGQDGPDSSGTVPQQQTARPSLCNGQRLTLAYSGDLSALCGR